MRYRAVAWFAAVSLSLGVPAVAQEAERSELDGARQDLADATRTVAELDRQLAAAQAELDEVDARLAAATADLHAVEQDLARAETALAEASARTMAAGRDLEAANADLAASRLDLADRHARLDRRVRNMYMHGSGPGALLLEGVVRASSLHEMTTTAKAVDRIANRDAGLVVDAVAATRAEAQARTGVAEAYAVQRSAEIDQARERDQVAALVARQTALVLDIDDDRRQRQAIVDQVAGDRLVATHLQTQLRARVSELAARLAASLLAADPTAGFDGPVPDWAAGLPAAGRNWSPVVAGAAARHGVDPRLLAALVWTESNFHPGAVSHAGAIGLAQLMPTTAAGLGVDPWDPVQNLLGGARYLRIQIERFGTVDLALAAYNAGPGRVEAAGWQVPAITETQLYVLRVLDRYGRLSGSL